MGLIIKNKIGQLMKGYPTVSDKYNAQGGFLQGAVDVKFGDLVIFGATAGTYEGVGANIALADIAGLVLATNVKLSLTYPATSAGVTTKPGEAFNLFLDGFIAIELDDTAVEADIKENGQVAVFLTAAGKQGKFTTTGVATSTDLATNWKFTGIYENIGTAIAPKFLAEIRVK